MTAQYVHVGPAADRGEPVARPRPRHCQLLVTRKSYLTAAVGLWILGSLLARIPVIFEAAVRGLAPRTTRRTYLQPVISRMTPLPVMLCWTLT